MKESATVKRDTYRWVVIRTCWAMLPAVWFRISFGLHNHIPVITCRCYSWPKTTNPFYSYTCPLVNFPRSWNDTFASSKLLGNTRHTLSSLITILPCIKVSWWILAAILNVRFYFHLQGISANATFLLLF